MHPIRGNGTINLWWNLSKSLKSKLQETENHDNGLLMKAIVGQVYEKVQS